MRTEVTRTYLALESLDRLVAAEGPHLEGLRLERVSPCPPAFYRFLYAEVGRAYRWWDRREWTDEQIRAHLGQHRISLHVLYGQGVLPGTSSCGCARTARPRSPISASSPISSAGASASTS